jgi:hypothetical protein
MVRTFTKRYLLPVLPALVLVGATGIAEAAAISHDTSVNVQTQSSGNNQSSNSDPKPVVSVNGRDVTVPANGTTTLNQGGTTTTVSNHQSDQNSAKPTGSQPTTTSSSGNGLNVSVTSTTSGKNDSHSFYFENSNSNNDSTVRSNVTIQASVDGTGSVSVTK